MWTSGGRVKRIRVDLRLEGTHFLGVVLLFRRGGVVATELRTRYQGKLVPQAPPRLGLGYARDRLGASSPGRRAGSWSASSR